MTFHSLRLARRGEPTFSRRYVEAIAGRARRALLPHTNDERLWMEQLAGPGLPAFRHMVEVQGVSVEVALKLCHLAWCIAWSRLPLMKDGPSCFVGGFVHGEQWRRALERAS